MKMRRCFPFGLFATLGFALFFMPQRAVAWDSPGHEVMATLAYRQLNPKAQAAVTEFAHELVNPDQTYDAITMSCWMDDLRKSKTMPYHGEFLSWHYIDISIDPRDPVPPLVPGNDDAMHGNVVQALKRAIAVLKGGADPYIKSKAAACALVVHLVGDIHQPLHCSTKFYQTHGAREDDKGGNKEYVMNGPPGDGYFNLHAFWDSAWRASFNPASGDVVIDRQFDDPAGHDASRVAALAQEWSTTVPTGKLDTDIDAWARESNAIAHNFVYPDVTMTNSRKYCRLSSAYVAKAQVTARERLILAAARLATLLNATLGADQPAAPPS